MNETPKIKSGWHWLRRILITLAVLATLVAIFYTEEDWRGKRAWENCKHELEAKGAVLDWDKYIPPPVPDDQNFFKASKKIAFSFVHSRNDAEAEFFAKQERIQFGPTTSNTFTVFDNTKASLLVVAQLTILTSDVKLASANTNSVFKLNDPAASDQIGKLIQKTVGQSANGSQGFQFSEIQFSNLVPAQIFVEADGTPSVSDLQNFIPPDTATNIGRLQIEATINKGVFQVVLAGVHITAAADYLKWSDQYEPDFNEIREALKRPYAQIDCDYSQPYSRAVPNFVTMRALAQTLAQRTQCYLLLGEPEKALHELTLMNDSRHVLTGKPMTLVSAMINVAISGLYVATIADGMRLHRWQELQLAAIQKQLAEINLTPFVLAALQEEPAAVCRDFEIESMPISEFINIGRISKSKWPGKIGDWLWPRGWTYQNMVNVMLLEKKSWDGFDLANNTVAPRIFEKTSREVDGFFGSDQPYFFGHNSPYKFLAAFAIPNFTKAEQTAAHNQTMVNEAQIACALERYHLAHGEYPETLDALAPQFMEKIPHDIIGGQPLHYRRTDDGKFLLYSIGWNEKDDGGKVVLTKGGSVDREKGDWVWQYPIKQN
jgi:hypothetical protein